MRRRRSRS
ncbi:hypothetical protein LINGRAHAP2_LOCUS36066 [Linum grandiflorum]